MDYARPSTLAEAVAALATREMAILCGGTDLYPSLRDRPLDIATLDISRIRGLRDVGVAPEGWRIGSAATWTDLVRADLPPCFDGLKAAGREIGSPQIQNAGTLAGNICNASPAADGMPPLLALDASVELVSAAGARTIPLAEFVTGVRRTARRRDEIVTAILVPSMPSSARSAFAKLGSRAHLVISIAMVAVTLVPDEAGNVAEARIAVGSCSPVAMRISGLEADLVGEPISGDLARLAMPHHVDALTPIDDVRASSDYRRHAALELVRRTLTAAGAWQGRGAFAA